VSRTARAGGSLTGHIFGGSSERLCREQDGKSGTLANWTHTWRGRKCIAGFQFTVCGLF
jgi:hypothetical protein